MLITTRARASENHSGSGGSRNSAKPKNPSLGTSSKSGKSIKSVALGSLRRGSNPKSATGSNSDAAESQEEILVQRDVVRSRLGPANGR